METEAIAEVLGGRNVLGRAIKKPEDLARLVRKGLPASSVTALAEKLHVGNNVSSREAGHSATHADSTPEPTSPPDVRRIRSHGSHGTGYATAVEMIGDQEKAIVWLGTPNRALGGERPLDQLDTDLVPAWSKTSSAVSPMACTANAVLENLSSPLCRGGHGRGRSAICGRWNSRGVRVVNASTSLALAAVESFVNVEPNLRPADLVAIEGEIPDGIEISGLNPEALPMVVREVQRSIRLIHEVVGTVQAFAFIRVGQNGARAIRLNSRNPPIPVLIDSQAAERVES